jgi:hypothetical protein
MGNCAGSGKGEDSQQAEKSGPSDASRDAGYTNTEVAASATVHKKHLSCGISIMEDTVACLHRIQTGTGSKDDVQNQVRKLLNDQSQTSKEMTENSEFRGQIQNRMWQIKE